MDGRCREDGMMVTSPGVNLCLFILVFNMAQNEKGNQVFADEESGTICFFFSLSVSVTMYKAGLI